MKTAPSQAYEAIRSALEADSDVRLVSQIYDPQAFGNFHLAYWRSGRMVSIVCDRGQIFRCSDLDANDCGSMVVELFDSDEDEVLDAIRKVW